MLLKEFNRLYRYKSDISEFGREEHWTTLSPSKDGYYYGDCEDYILTIIDKVEGFKDLQLFYCKINGNGHCVGVLNEQIIDCNCKRFLSIAEYTKLYSMTHFRKFMFVEVLVKKLRANISRVINKIFG